MKNLLLLVVLFSITCLASVSTDRNFVTITGIGNTSDLVNSMEITTPPDDDCGGCVAWADSRDDGSDRTLTKWRRDVNSCRANSPECNNDGPPELFNI